MRKNMPKKATNEKNKNDSFRATKGEKNINNSCWKEQYIVCGSEKKGVPQQKLGENHGIDKKLLLNHIFPNIRLGRSKLQSWPRSELLLGKKF